MREDIPAGFDEHRRIDPDTASGIRGALANIAIEMGTQRLRQDPDFTELPETRTSTLRAQRQP